MKKKRKEVFALDIGTRSIVGIFLEETEEGLNLKDILIREHPSRAMLDGQIHNIPEVSNLVKQVMDEIEKKNKTKIKNVAVAAAGRSLKTIKTKVFQNFNNQVQINYEDILKLELKGAQKAQAMLWEENKESKNNQYYCVGYSISKYYLNDSEIGSLLGQKGEKAGLEIVAAFLPKVVVESLQTVLANNGLELSNLTLEPIAAINAILLPTMRKLNLALVDVGAGTSDIAISLDGSISAYGMVPFAGDEVTEFLCDKLLLEFYEGEKIKRLLKENETIEFTDILGFTQSLSSEEILDNIRDIVKELATKISEEILRLNGKPPQAVILIGGGSLTPLLNEFIADNLKISKQRVAVQNASTIREIINLPQENTGPDIITPLGIAITALKHTTLGFVPVEVNKCSVNLLNLGNNTVFDALLAAGIDTSLLYGKPGLALTVEVNGQLKVFPGTMGEKSLVKVNNKESSLDAVLVSGDKIQYIPARDGKNGKGKVKDIIPNLNKIMVNDRERELPWEILINGKKVDYNYELIDGSKIYIREIDQLGELLEYWNIDEKDNYINITLINDKKEESFQIYSLQFYREGMEIDLFEKVNHNDKIQIIQNKEKFFLKSFLSRYIHNDIKENMLIKVNGDLIEMTVKDFFIKVNGDEVNKDYLLKDKDVITFTRIEKKPMLIDIFSKINFSLNLPPDKKSLKIMLNGKEAEYTTPLKDNDEISIFWN